MDNTTFVVFEFTQSNESAKYQFTVRYNCTKNHIDNIYCRDVDTDGNRLDYNSGTIWNVPFKLKSAKQCGAFFDRKCIIKFEEDKMMLEWYIDILDETFIVELYCEQSPNMVNNLITKLEAIDFKVNAVDVPDANSDTDSESDTDSKDDSEPKYVSTESIIELYESIVKRMDAHIGKLELELVDAKGQIKKYKEQITFQNSKIYKLKKNIDELKQGKHIEKMSAVDTKTDKDPYAWN
jgi:hypothetical protein